MDAAVKEIYPVDDDTQHLPPWEQTHCLPAHLFTTSDFQEPAAKKTCMWYVKDKSQTPGRGAQDSSQVLYETRLSAVTAIMIDTSSSDPATRRMGAVMAHGTVKVKTCQTFVDS